MKKYLNDVTAACSFDEANGVVVLKTCTPTGKEVLFLASGNIPAVDDFNNADGQPRKFMVKGKIFFRGRPELEITKCEEITGDFSHGRSSSQVKLIGEVVNITEDDRVLVSVKTGDSPEDVVYARFMNGIVGFKWKENIGIADAVVIKGHLGNHGTVIVTAYVSSHDFPFALTDLAD